MVQEEPEDLKFANRTSANDLLNMLVDGKVLIKIPRPIIMKFGRRSDPIICFLYQLGGKSKPRFHCAFQIAIAISQFTFLHVRFSLIDPPVMHL